MIISRDAGHRFLQPYLGRFRQAIYEGEMELNEFCGTRKHRLRTRSITSMLNDFVAQHAIAVFDDCPEIRFAVMRGLLIMYIHDEAVLRIKKIGRNFKSRNIRTGQTIQYLYQLPMADMPPLAPHYIVGYQADALGAVDGAYVTLPDGDDVGWVISLDNEGLLPLSEIAPPPAEPKQPSSRVRLRGTAATEQEAGDGGEHQPASG
jgi:hypothetical protein